jgi:HEAT repeat protein
MYIFGSRKPNVQKLVRRRDLEGLVEAASFQDIVANPNGPPFDIGVPVREEAIVAMGELGPSTGNGIVAGALRDPSDRVRVAAVQVLYARGDVEPLIEALGWLPADAGHSRQLALRAVLELAESRSARPLARALARRTGDDPIREEEVQLLKSLMGEEKCAETVHDVVEDLIVALADARAIVADRAVDLLVSLTPASTQGLIAELDAGAAPDRAALALSRIKDTRALEALVRALGHRDPRVRAESAGALGELRDPAAAEALLRATRDPEHVVRTRASRALDQIGIVAVVFGVSALMQPMIHQAVAAAQALPAAGGTLSAPSEATDAGTPEPTARPRTTRARKRPANGTTKASAKAPTRASTKASSKGASKASSKASPKASSKASTKASAKASSSKASTRAPSKTTADGPPPEEE